MLRGWTLLSTIACLSVAIFPAHAGNFEFVVTAERGLDLRITGYAADGAEMFEDAAPSSETRDGTHAYVIRVDETILKATPLAAWCIEDRSGKWSVPSSTGVMACDDRPSETRGSYLFTARAERPGTGGGGDTPTARIEKVAPQPSQRVLVACIQTELGAKGFNAGPADGQMGARTLRAAEAYLEATADAKLAPLADDNLATWCEALAAHEGKPFQLHTKGDIAPFVALDQQVAVVQRTISAIFGTAPLETITFYISKDENWLADKYLAANGLGANFRPSKVESFGKCDPVAEFGYRSAFVCAAAELWSRGAGMQMQVIAHEYFHALSGDQARRLGEKACCYDLSRMGPLGPEWLKEGGAQFAALATLEELGAGDLDAVMGRFAPSLRDKNLDIAGRNTREGYNRLGRDVSENVGVLAAYVLTERAGRKALATYYRYLGYEVGHEEAFMSAFGVSISELQLLLDEFVAGS